MRCNMCVTGSVVIGAGRAESSLLHFSRQDIVSVRKRGMLRGVRRNQTDQTAEDPRETWNSRVLDDLNKQLAKRRDEVARTKTPFVKRPRPRGRFAEVFFFNGPSNCRSDTSSSIFVVGLK